MQVTKSFPGHCLATHDRPWLALVTGWADRGPPACTFGKSVRGSNPITVTLEAQPGDVVKWGAKEHATGASDAALAGWGIVEHGGTVRQCSQTMAQTVRRAAHPEDAKLAPVTFKGKGRPYARQAAAAVAPTSTTMPLAGAPVEVLAEALLRASGHPNPGSDELQSVIAFARALVAPPVHAARAPARAPAPVLPAYVPPSNTPVDADGVPLF